MPRRRRLARGRLGVLLSDALDRRGLTPQEVAAAARIHKGTLYKLLSGETRTPHYSTLRQLCKVLQLDIVQAIGAEQLDLLESSLQESGTLERMKDLLLREIESFPSTVIQIAAETAVMALLEVKLGAGKGPDRSYLKDVRQTPREQKLRIVSLVNRQLEEVPKILQPAAVKSALGVLVDLKLTQGHSVSSEVFASLNVLRQQLWLAFESPKRKRHGSRHRVSGP